MRVETGVDLARHHAPLMHFDAREPFFPRWVGVTCLDAPGHSPSFRRSLVPPTGGCVIEYAIYWDWDIQHLYDLEHIWLYLGEGGGLVDAEASFHGRYLKSIPPSALPAAGRRLTLYSQPGKHAFSPLPELFRLLPDCELATGVAAGAAGAEVPWPLRDRIQHDPAWDEPVRRFLAQRRFVPAWEFVPWEIPDSMIVDWAELDARLPDLFRAGLAEAGVG